MQTTIHKRNTWGHWLFWGFVFSGLIALCLMGCDANATETKTEGEKANEFLEELAKDAPLKSFRISELGSLKIVNTQLQKRILELELELLATKEWMRGKGLLPEAMNNWRLDLDTKTFMRKK